MPVESQGNGAPKCLPFVKDRLHFLNTVSIDGRLSGFTEWVTGGWIEPKSALNRDSERMPRASNRQLLELPLYSYRRETHL